MHLTTTSATSPPTAEIRASGELDLASAGCLWRAITDALRLRCADINVNLTDLTFMDCSGIYVLLRGRRAASENGGRLRLTSVSPAVERVITLARVGTLLRAS